MSQTMANADLICIELAEYHGEIARNAADGVVTPEERAREEAMYRPLQRRAKRGALMQRVGHSIERTCRLDKNLMTMLRALCAEQEEAATGAEAVTAVAEKSG